MSTSSNSQLATRVITEMINRDRFSQWLNMQLVHTGEGYCKLQMKLTEDMVNGFGLIHGGVLFSLADSAFAFACNSRNQLSVALDVTITYTRPSKPGDTLTAEAKEVHNGKRTGVYLVTITNQNDEQVGLFKGTCFRKEEAVIQYPSASPDIT